MWSSTFHSAVLALALAACSDPDIVIDVTNTTGNSLEVFVCPAGALHQAGCKPHQLAANEHSIGIFTTEPMVRIELQSGFCQQLDLDLGSGSPIDVSYTLGATAADVVEKCSPDRACQPLADCQ
jgi:hypothetical protein